MGPQSTGADGVDTANRWKHVVRAYFGTLQTRDRSAEWSRRAERDVSGRHPMRKHDIHVSVARYEEPREEEEEEEED